jgi:hypothetical protein
MYTMKRTTIFLEESLLRRSRGLAQRRGISFAELIRRAVTRYLAEEEGGAARVPGIAGRFASGEADTAERAEELLWMDPHG